MKIAVIVGSLRNGSYNHVLAHALVERLPAGSEVEWLKLTEIPFVNEDLEAEVPEVVQLAAQQVAEADGLLIVSPEYNRGIPAVTKNIVDWLSRPSTGHPLKGKPVAIAGISSGPIKTMVMQSQLRPVLAHTQAVVLTAPVIALTIGDDNMTASGGVSDVTARHLDAYIAAFMVHVERYTERV
ncbi:NADPH-dependent FMN reductase [Candidatus Mycosynbacter amalyticus]|uniref:NADPH-dependent FMN reductase n=1 Tax=Candidatus Mycosynbacter amalyticus TaxID=2665156 RepID=A0A857MIY9_9BACT|nr:NAD(P)H-dependent oxidoreductase [Candidatus Mycosynbacter amalyticus]QHN42534.1 NADPH-dependent FMN reductase [Candidatus Mycosynbacter amalyticus]